MFEYLRFSLLGNFHVCAFRAAWIVTNKPTGSLNKPNNFQLIWKTLYVVHFGFSLVIFMHFILKNCSTTA